MSDGPASDARRTGGPTLAHHRSSLSCPVAVQWTHVTPATGSAQDRAEVATGSGVAPGEAPTASGNRAAASTVLKTREFMGCPPRGAFLLCHRTPVLVSAYRYDAQQHCGRISGSIQQ